MHFLFIIIIIIIVIIIVVISIINLLCGFPLQTPPLSYINL